MSEAVDFIVKKTDLRQTAFVPGRDSAASVLPPGHALLRIDRFAFTANNITYGAIADLVGYWSFFPTREGWGRIPVWGFADVVGSSHDALAAGERIYGYLPMSTYLAVQADHVSPAGFIDAAPHRAALPPIYNRYACVAADAAYDRAYEAHLAIFRPLFTTAFLLDDFLAERAFFGARSIILASASSKTALGLAFLLSTTRRNECDVIGLTSPANKAFVERTGYYNRTIVYSDLESLRGDASAVFVDFAGNFDVVRGVHETLGQRLKYSCAVGVTHWEKIALGAEVAGPAPILFFAPEQARKRTEEWGGGPSLQSRVAQAMRGFLESSSGWLRIDERHGEAAVQSIYQAALDGKIDPAVGQILSL